MADKLPYEEEAPIDIEEYAGQAFTEDETDEMDQIFRYSSNINCILDPIID